eukprot:2619819-Prorocentrum_lima.AAC.1
MDLAAPILTAAYPTPQAAGLTAAYPTPQHPSAPAASSSSGMASSSMATPRTEREIQKAADKEDAREA